MTITELDFIAHCDIAIPRHHGLTPTAYWIQPPLIQIKKGQHCRLNKDSRYKIWVLNGYYMDTSELENIHYPYLLSIQQSSIAKPIPQSFEFVTSEDIQVCIDKPRKQILKFPVGTVLDVHWKASNSTWYIGGFQVETKEFEELHYPFLIDQFEKSKLPAKLPYNQVYELPKPVIPVANLVKQKLPCKLCLGKGRIEEEYKPCPSCYGRGGFWNEQMELH